MTETAPLLRGTRSATLQFDSSVKIDGAPGPRTIVPGFDSNRLVSSRGRSLNPSVLSSVFSIIVIVAVVMLICGAVMGVVAAFRDRDDKSRYNWERWEKSLFLVAFTLLLLTGGGLIPRLQF